MSRRRRREIIYPLNTTLLAVMSKALADGMTESVASKKSTATAEGVSPSGEAALLRPQGDFLEKREIGHESLPGQSSWIKVTVK